MKVSIIVTNYNYDKYIEECLLSIYKQNYSNIELILIDDNSSDNSLEKINSILTNHYKNDLLIIKCFHENNIGLRKSILEGLEKSTGEYIMRIDADDFLVGNNSISNKVKLLKEDSDLGFVYSNHNTIDGNSKKINNFINHDFKEDFVGYAFDKIILGNKIIASGTLVNKKYIKYIKKYIWDWDLWLYLSKDFKIGYVNEIGISYRVHSTSMSKKVRNNNEGYNNKNQGIKQKDYTIMHGFDLVEGLFKNIENNKINKNLKRKALGGCYRFGAIYLLKSNRIMESFKFFFLSFYYDFGYYIKNLNKIFYIIFNIKKI